MSDTIDDALLKELDNGKLSTLPARLKRQLQKGAGLDYQDSSGKTALHRLLLAARQDGSVQICTNIKESMHILLNGGASVDIKDNTGQTVVHLAAVENMPFEVLFPLLQKCNIQELSVAAVHQLMSTDCLNVDMLVALCRSDVDLLALGGTNVTAIHCMVQKRRPINALLLHTLASERSIEFNTIKDNLLLHACIHGSKETLQALVQLDASATARDTVFELPAVLLAASSGADEEAVEKVNILVAYGANCHITSSNGQNLCHIAAVMRNVKLLELAIAARVDHTHRDKEGSSPLHYACSAPENGPVISLLIEAGLDVHEPNADGFTPLNLSIRSKHVDNIIPLIKALVDFKKSKLKDCLFQDIQILAQPEIIAASNKPLEYALMLSSFYERMAQVQRRLKHSYMALSVELEDAAIDMIEGLESSQLQGLALHADVIERAILNGRKKFIATEAVQYELQQVWLEWQESSYSGLVKAFIKFLLQAIARPLVIFVVWPLIVLNIRICGHSLTWDIIRPHASPSIRYRVEAFAYTYFVVLLLIQTANTEFSTLEMSASEWIIMVYILALLYNEVVTLVREGFHFYFTRLGHKRSCFTILMFIVFFLVRLSVTYGHVKSESTIRRLSSYLLAGATIMACIQILQYLRVHPLIGPIQKSFRRVQTNLLFFIVILFLYLLAFASGLVNVYAASNFEYDETRPEGLNETRPEEPEHCHNTAFKSLPSSTLTLFWSLFGLIEHDDLDSCTLADEIVGKILFGLWVLQALIILLNMLIALVTNKFDEVQNNADIEWKFSFGATVIDVRKCQRFPIPFNLLHIPVDLLEWLFNRDNFMKRRFALLSINHCIRGKSGRRNASKLQIDVFRKAEERKTLGKAATRADVVDMNERLRYIEKSLSSVCGCLNIQSRSDSTASTLGELRRDSLDSYRQRLNTLTSTSEYIDDVTKRSTKRRDRFKKTLIHRILEKTESITNPSNPTHTKAKSPASPLPLIVESECSTTVTQPDALTQALTSLQQSLRRQECTLLQIEARLANLENQGNHSEIRYSKPTLSLPV